MNVRMKKHSNFFKRSKIFCHRSWQENLNASMGMLSNTRFCKKTYGNHFEVIGNVFKFLSSEKGLISDDFMRLQLMKLDKLEGNVNLFK